MYCAKIRMQFEKNKNKRNENFFRYINEVPTILFIVIVFLAVFKPGIWQTLKIKLIIIIFPPNNNHAFKRFKI